MSRKARIGSERILQAAMAFVKRNGLERLSMRNIAQALRVAPMSLYKHVRNKEEVLDGLADMISGEIAVPGPEVGWRQAMAQRGASTRKILLRHPWAGGLLESRKVSGPNQLRMLDSSLGSLRRGGFSVESAARATLLMDSYAYGFTMQELKGKYADDRPSKAASRIAQHVTPESHPYLAEMAGHIASGASGNAFTSLLQEFEQGLELILDSIGKLRGPASRIRRGAISAADKRPGGCHARGNAS